MGASTHQEIDVLGTVVYGVEAPKKGNFMAATMAEVCADITDDQCGDNLKPGGPCRGGSSQSTGNRVVNEPSHQGKGSTQQKSGNEAANEVVGDIGEDRFPEYFLRVQREETLERHKDDSEKYQPYAEADDREEKFLIEESRHLMVS